MSEVSDRYAVVADGFTARVVGITSDRWSTMSPCTQWTVGDLVGQVISTHRRVMANLEGTEFVEPDPGTDPVEVWQGARDDLAAALADDRRAGHMMGGMFGDQPLESLVGRLVCSDTLIHTWDLARATGQDERLDGEAVAKAMAALAPLDESIRRPGGFGPKIEPRPGADAQTVFLNFCGRPA